MKLDKLSHLKGQTVSTGVYENIPTGQALEVIADAGGWPIGQVTLNYWWLDDADAFEAVRELMVIDESL